MKKGRVTIIRSAVGCLSAMALINELKRENVKVIGIDCNPISAGLYICDKGYVVPKGDDPEFLDEILKICKAEKPNAILSGPEEEILVLSKKKCLFEELGVMALCPDYDIVRMCVDKAETQKVFKKQNIPTPEIYDENKVKFPCIIKPRFGRGGKDLFKVRDEEELEFYRNKVEKPLIQEFVGGVEYTIDILSDLEGNPLSIVPRVRLHAESGISTKGMTINDQEIIGYCKDITENLKLIGPSCVQCIKDENGITKFTEINPRFGGGSILSIKADPTIIPNLIRMIKGETLTPSNSFREGLTMLRYYSEVFITKDERAKNLDKN